ncbi:hypothetical protein SEA_OLIVE_79 [Mycobacterium phage Olive]|nr:hypothetical protein SEA_OLIVE_79 [Mycobacterium phage Olive]
MWPDLADVGTVALVGSVAGALYPLTRVLLAHIDRRRARDNRPLPYSRAPEAREWCAGCGRTPVRRLMAWDAEGRYLCLDCRHPEDRAVTVHRKRRIVTSEADLGPRPRGAR